MGDDVLFRPKQDQVCFLFLSVLQFPFSISLIKRKKMGRKKAQSNLGQTLIKDRFRNVRSVTTSTGERALVRCSKGV